jgi:hypothetical protein
MLCANYSIYEVNGVGRTEWKRESSGNATRIHKTFTVFKHSHPAPGTTLVTISLPGLAKPLINRHMLNEPNRNRTACSHRSGLT